jgi:ABC-type Zn2+ transport system substrate-binding protein/surface adhesin
MVVFVDLDDHPDEVEHHQHQHGHTTQPFDMRDLINAHAARSISHSIETEIEGQEEEDTEQEHPNLNALSAVLGNYPFVILLLPE